MQLMLTLAFTVKLQKIHTCSHTCTHQPPTSISSLDRFLPTNGKHTNNYQPLTYQLVQNATHFRTMFSMKGFYWLYMDHVYSGTFIFFFSLQYAFHPLTSHLLFQPNTVKSVAFRKTSCTNLEICHTILPQIA